MKAIIFLLVALGSFGALAQHYDSVAGCTALSVTTERSLLNLYPDGSAVAAGGISVPNQAHCGLTVVVANADITLRIKRAHGTRAGLRTVSGLTQTVTAGSTLELMWDANAGTVIDITGESAGTATVTADFRCAL